MLCYHVPLFYLCLIQLYNVWHEIDPLPGLLYFIASAILFNFIDFANENGNGTWGVSDYQWCGLIAHGTVLVLCVHSLPNWTSERESDNSSKAPLERI